MAPSKTIKTVIAGIGVPERLSRCLLDMTGILSKYPRLLLTTANRNRLIDLLTQCPLEILAVGDLSVAMVTRGGVALSEVHPKTMESKSGTGSYFAGAILDIDGDTGGFNLQAAFSTGFLRRREFDCAPGNIWNNLNWRMKTRSHCSGMRRCRV